MTPILSGPKNRSRTVWGTLAVLTGLSFAGGDSLSCLAPKRSRALISRRAPNRSAASIRSGKKNQPRRTNRPNARNRRWTTLRPGARRGRASCLSSIA